MKRHFLKDIGTKGALKFGLIKMSGHPELIRTFRLTAVKLPAKFFMATDQLVVTVIWKGKGA